MYLSLVEMYLHPPSLKDLGISLPNSPRLQCDVETAMIVLATHHERINTAKVTDIVHTHTHMHLHLVAHICDGHGKGMGILNTNTVVN